MKSNYLLLEMRLPCATAPGLEKNQYVPYIHNNLFRPCDCLLKKSAQ